MRTTIILGFAVFLLASCGEGSAPSNCDRSEGSPGETVTCSVKGFQEDCTCFIGGVPTDCGLISEGEVEMTIPPRTGTVDITFACGAGDPRTIQKDFSVILPDQPAGPCEDDSDCDDGQVCWEGSCITLGGGDCAVDSDCPSGEVCVAGRCLIQPEDPPDSTGCTSNADCPDGTVCDDGACVSPPPPGPLQVSFVETGTNKTEALHDTELGLIRIKWKKTGEEPQQFYLYGPFNRRTDTEGCEKEGSRYLAVNSGGNEIPDGSPNANTYRRYLAGETCDEAAGNCLGFTHNPGDATFCKIDLREVGVGGVFYTRFHTKNAKFVIAAQAQDGHWETDEAVFEAPAPEIDGISVTMMGDRPAVRVQFSYRYAVLVGLDGCQSDIPLNMPNVDLEGVLIDSDGSVNAACKLTGPSKTFTMTVRGIDPSETLSEIYRVELGEPDLTLTNGTFYEAQTGTFLCAGNDSDWWKDCDRAGELELYARVRRPVTVLRKTGASFETVSTENVPWVGSMEIRAYGPNKVQGCGQAGPLTVPSSGELPEGLERSGDQLKMIVRLRRDHGCTEYEAIATELGNNIFLNGGPGSSVYRVTASFPYEPYFEEISIPETLRRECSFTHECEYLALSQGACGDEGDADRCDNGGDGPGGCDTWDHDVDYETVYRAQFRGRHLKGIRYVCYGNRNEERFTSELEEDSYQEQILELKGEDEGRVIVCNLTVTFYDGREKDITVSWECPKHHYPGED